MQRFQKIYIYQNNLILRKLTINTPKLRNKILNQTALDIYSITNSSIEVGNDNNTNNGDNYDCNVLNENSNACNTSFQTCGNGMHTTPCVAQYGGGVEM